VSEVPLYGHLRVQGFMSGTTCGDFRGVGVSYEQGTPVEASLGGALCGWQPY